MSISQTGFIGTMGWWIKDGSDPTVGARAVHEAIMRLSRPVFLVDCNGQLGVAQDGQICIGSTSKPANGALPLRAYAPPLMPEDLGDALLKRRYGLKYAYIAGAMANGITSVKMLEAMAKAGMIGFFGAAGLSPAEVDLAMGELRQNLGSLPFGTNLINSPNEPELEFKLVECYLKHEVCRISASAYINLTLPLIYYRVKGVHRDLEGNIVAPNRVIGKISRIEVARRFLSPPPEKFLRELVSRGLITVEEADLAQYISVAQDITAEADSGGHTDNRPAISLLPTILALRDELVEKFGYQQPIGVGLGGGIATPASTAAAFAMGAAFVLTGSVNQSCLESGTSAVVRKMLAQTQQADITMAPAADMFEQGVKVQVLKRGSMFPQRAARLYDLYCRYGHWDQIPRAEQAVLEKDIFRCSFAEEWAQTRQFFLRRDPAQVERAERDPRHLMALVFRSYLGQSSVWAITGEPSRAMDYQVWCGPSMGAFNEWVKGSFLELPEKRKVVDVALNLLFGSAVILRLCNIKTQQVELERSVGTSKPLSEKEINRWLT